MNSYYYLDAANQQQGPVEGNLLPSKGVTAQTHVWANGMAEWTPAGQVAELQPLFAAQPVVAPVQPAQPAYQQPAQPAYQQTAQPAYQQTAQHASTPVKPNNYFIWSVILTILPTLCCCSIPNLVMGIMAWINSSKVDRFYMHGCYTEAQAASKSAKDLNTAGGIVIGLSLLLYIIIWIIYGAAILSIMENYR